MVGLQQTRREVAAGWRVALLQTSLLVGAWVVVQSELLSLVKALNQPGVILAWLLILGTAVVIGWRKGILQAGWRSFRNSLRSPNRLEWIFLATLGIILALILLGALLSPANTTDSLQYHMSRVVHWAENHSLAHYPTGYAPQVMNPIMAELAILNLRLLWGNDQLVNLVQWCSMLLALVGVSTLASKLVSERASQLAAVAFAASLPMGILQATSTQNDYVTALWLTSLAVMVILACQSETGIEVTLSIGAALGLGMVTKGTFYPYAVPFLIWLFLHWLHQGKWNLILKRSILIIAIVLILNLGFWARNITTFGGPLGPSGWVDEKTTGGGVMSLAARLVENITFNFAPPDQPTTQWMQSAIRSIFLNADPSVKDFQLIWRWNHEDYAGNPLHLCLIAAASLTLWVLVLKKRVTNRDIVWYTCAVLGSFVMLIWVIWFDTQFGVRYQLPFFVVSAPLFGVACVKAGGRRFATGAAFFCLLAALPWVFFNRTRPLIGLEKNPGKFAIRPLPYMGYTDISSILTVKPETILFANWTYLQKPYSQVTQEVKASNCMNIGLRIDSHDNEYALWWLLGAPQSGRRLENLYYGTEFARFADPDFRPCAIICTICNGRTRLHGLELKMNTGEEAQLFMGGIYDPDPDK
jgi:hypothetical protein